MQASSEGEIDAAYAKMVEVRAGALLVAADPVKFNQRDRLVALAAWLERRGFPSLDFVRGSVGEYRAVRFFRPLCQFNRYLILSLPACNCAFGSEFESNAPERSVKP